MLLLLTLRPCGHHDIYLDYAKKQCNETMHLSTLTGNEVMLWALCGPLIPHKKDDNNMAVQPQVSSSYSWVTETTYAHHSDWKYVKSKRSLGRSRCSDGQKKSQFAIMMYESFLLRSAKAERLQRDRLCAISFPLRVARNWGERNADRAGIGTRGHALRSIQTRTRKKCARESRVSTWQPSYLDQIQYSHNLTNINK